MKHQELEHIDEWCGGPVGSKGAGGWTRGDAGRRWGEGSRDQMPHESLVGEGPGSGVWDPNRFREAEACSPFLSPAPLVCDQGPRTELAVSALVSFQKRVCPVGVRSSSWVCLANITNLRTDCRNQNRARKRFALCSRHCVRWP